MGECPTYHNNSHKQNNAKKWSQDNEVKIFDRLLNKYSANHEKLFITHERNMRDEEMVTLFWQYITKLKY